MLRLKSRIIWVSVILTLTACGWKHIPPPTERPKNAFEIAASFDEVWKAVVRVYADRNIGIAALEKDSGLIASDPIILPIREFLQYMDPGEVKAGLSSGVPTDSRLYSNIFAERVSGNKTIVRINLRGTVEWVAKGSCCGPPAVMPIVEIGTTTCQSTGLLEKAFFDEIKIKVHKSNKKT